MPLSALVIGGGPAGAAAAIHLARAGADVTLFERTKGAHDKVCGDFLGGQALDRLAALGIDVPALGGVAIDRVRLLAGTHMVEAPLPFPARSLSRRILDQALLDRATAAGAKVRRGEAVRTLDTAPGRIIVLATGKHDLRERPRPGRRSGAVGLKTYVTLAPDQAAGLRGKIELILLPDGYAGLQPIGERRAVLCVARWREAMRPGGHHRLLDDLAQASPHLRRRFTGATATDVLAIAGVPYGYLLGPHPSVFHLGDQAAVIPSLAGEGVSIALLTAELAARCILTGEGPRFYAEKLRAALRRPMRVAMGAQRLASLPPMQRPLVGICSLWPFLIGFTATRTRC